MNQTETAVWDKIQGLALRFQQASRIVLGVPMWNFADPYSSNNCLIWPVSVTCSLPMTARSTAFC